MFDPLTTLSATLVPALVAAVIIALTVWQRPPNNDEEDAEEQRLREPTPYASTAWALAIVLAVLAGYFATEIFEKAQSSKTGYGSGYGEMASVEPEAPSVESAPSNQEENGDDASSESTPPTTDSGPPEEEVAESESSAGNASSDGADVAADSDSGKATDEGTATDEGNKNGDETKKPQFKMPEITFEDLKQPTTQVFQSALKPIEARQWIPAVALVSVVLAILGGLFPRWGMSLNWILFTAAIGLLAYLILRNSVYMTAEWKGQTAYFWLGAIAGVAGLAWLFIVSEVPGNSRGTLFLGGIVAACTAVAIASSGSLKYGLLAGIVASAMGGAFMASWLLRRAANNLGWATPVIALTTLMIVVSHFFSDLKPVHAGLLIASWLLVGLRPSSGWFVGILSLVPAAIAACWAASTAMQQTGAG